MNNTSTSFTWKYIVEGMQQGDNTAFDAFYNLTYSKLKKRILFKTGFNEQDAEDLLQETYIRVFSRINDLKDPEAVIGWTNTICDSIYLDHVKKENRRAGIANVVNESAMQSQDDDTDDFSLAMIADPDADIEALIEQQEVQKILQEIISSLPDMYRSCIELQMSDKSVKEIAQELQLNENTAKTLIRRAKMQIKDKVLDLEKKGTKLYGVAPLVFFVWVYRIWMAKSEYLPTGSAAALADMASASAESNGNPGDMNPTPESNQGSANGNQGYSKGVHAQLHNNSELGITEKLSSGKTISSAAPSVGAATSAGSASATGAAGMGMVKIIAIVAAGVVAAAAITIGTVIAVNNNPANENTYSVNNDNTGNGNNELNTNFPDISEAKAETSVEESESQEEILVLTKEDLLGVWEGFYSRSKDYDYRHRDLKLTISDVTSSGDIDGFGVIDSGDSGIFRISGKVDFQSCQIDMDISEWVINPNNWRPELPFFGYFTEKDFCTGMISPDTNRTFELTKISSEISNEVDMSNSIATVSFFDMADKIGNNSATKKSGYSNKGSGEKYNTDNIYELYYSDTVENYYIGDTKGNYDLFSGEIVLNSYSNGLDSFRFEVLGDEEVLYSYDFTFDDIKDENREYKSDAFDEHAFEIDISGLDKVVIRYYKLYDRAEHFFAITNHTTMSEIELIDFQLHPADIIRVASSDDTPLQAQDNARFFELAKKNGNRSVALKRVVSNFGTGEIYTSGNTYELNYTSSDDYYYYLENNGDFTNFSGKVVLQDYQNGYDTMRFEIVGDGAVLYSYDFKRVDIVDEATKSFINTALSAEHDFNLDISGINRIEVKYFNMNDSTDSITGHNTMSTIGAIDFYLE